MMQVVKAERPKPAPTKSNQEGEEKAAGAAGARAPPLGFE